MWGIAVPTCHLWLVVARFSLDGRSTLQRLFSTFPSGAAGVGLLVLRAAAGGTLAAQGVIHLFSPPSLTMTVLAASIFLTLTGVFILIGFLTPIVSPLAALECAAALVWSTLPWGLLSSNFVVCRLIAMFVAIALIGPGAFSVDAHIFGWKEIVIPSATQHREEE
jgi:uncharacterized membrane protein YphA (DoxX/SURF4 family)